MYQLIIGITIRIQMHFSEHIDCGGKIDRVQGDCLLKICDLNRSHHI
jgi:hypothetical protein